MAGVAAGQPGGGVETGRRNGHGMEGVAQERGVMGSPTVVYHYDGVKMTGVETRNASPRKRRLTNSNTGERGGRGRESWVRMVRVYGGEGTRGRAEVGGERETRTHRLLTYYDRCSRTEHMKTTRLEEAEQNKE